MINTSTFRDCPALTTVTFPDSVAIIKEQAFMNCDELKDVYFTGSQDMWNQISIEDSNPCLEAATIHYDTAVTSAYKINSLSVMSADGKPASAIPSGSFLTTVSVTNCTSGGSPVIFLAAYGGDGQYQGLMYVTVQAPVGGTAEITLPVDNPDGTISRVKAFAVKSFADLEVIGSPVSFPAE